MNSLPRGTVTATTPYPTGLAQKKRRMNELGSSFAIWDHPFLNDTLAMIQGHRKLLVKGGLAPPSIPKGQRGTATPLAFYDLRENP